jgi:hypothetical protein
MWVVAAGLFGNTFFSGRQRHRRPAGQIVLGVAKASTKWALYAAVGCD